MASSSKSPDPDVMNFKVIQETISILQQRISAASGSILQANPEKRYQPDKLCRDLNHIMDVFSNIGNYLGSEVTTSLNELGKKLEHLLTSIDNAPSSADQQVQDLIHQLGKSIHKLKTRLPSLPDELSANSYVNGKLVIGDRFSVDPEISSLYNRGIHQYGFTVDEFREIFEGLGDGVTRLLLFFAVFPSGSVINKRVMKNWWDGECVVDLCSTDEAEETTNLMIEELTECGLIKPVREKCALIGFKMNPLIQPMVVRRAEEDGLFSFDFKGNPSVDQLSDNNSNRAFLVNGNGERRSRDELELASFQDDLCIKKLQTLFNINESYPDFTFDLFFKLRNLRVLSLGRWQSSSDHHVELEDTQFLEALKYMKSLRYLSLRGISRIFELPDSVCKLISLRILDLNACHNLEELPDSIGSLQNLISLDISECYLLEKIPEGLALLTELRILKGFLVTSEIGEGCSFTDLGELKKLIKLSVNANRDNFPNTEDFHTFKKFELLQKLTISWGGKSKSISMNEATGNKPLKKILSKLGSMKQESIKSVQVPEDCFRSVNKLNLQCYPHEQVEWLKPQHFKRVSKLCIQGGKLRKLAELENDDDCWKQVESLHLKFLSELQISLLHLKGSFPDLTYLEVISCEKLVGFNSDDELGWLKEHHSATLRIQNNAGRDDHVQGSIWLK